MTTTLPWSKVVLWGGKVSLDSSRHIYRGWYETLRKLGHHVEWVNDEPASRASIQPGCMVFLYDIWSAHIGDAVPGVDYLVHNLPGSHNLQQTADLKNIVRLQTYTNEAVGEPWDAFGTRYWLQENHTLFQPWGANLLSEEFLPPQYNSTARDCVFVGAVWDDGGLGNEATIPALQEEIGRRGYRFVHLTQIPEQEMIDAIRGSRFAPALAGPWQVARNYLPCRSFKAVSYGVLNVTNVPKFSGMMPSAPLENGVEGIVDWALSLRREQYEGLVREQQRVVSNFTFRESLECVVRAFERAKED